MSKIDLTGGTVVSLFLGGIASIALMIAWAGFWSGLTLSILWGWFIAPAFGLPALSIIHAYGVVLVYRAMHGIGRGSNKPNEEFVRRATFLPPLLAAVMIGAGWVAKTFM